MYIKSNMYSYAIGYHDGRMDRDRETDLINPEYYNQGYEDGVEDRDEQDEWGL